MERACDHCGALYVAKMARSRYCKPGCRAAAAKRAKREAAKAGATDPVAKPRRLVSVGTEGAGKPPSRPTPAVSAPAPTPVPPEAGGPLTEATRAELVRLQSVGSPSGQLALRLAGLLDDPPLLAISSVAGWAREHRAAMAEVREAAAAAGIGVERPESALDRIRGRRDAKRGAG